MINPFTAQIKVDKLQKEVLGPLYVEDKGQEDASHEWLLVLTGRVIADNQSFIEEICSSRFIAVIFKIVKLLGGADQLTEDDFDRFTSYVNDGGIRAMVKMLLAADKEKTFLVELQGLPLRVRDNAPQMLRKAAELHHDFISGFFREQYGSAQVPAKLLSNFKDSDGFLKRLAKLAAK